MIHGVDVASYQPERFPLTIPVTGEPVDFAIIKVTQGLGYVNPKWVAQLTWARAHDLSVGFYHFADAGSIDKQADYFLSTVGAWLKPGDHLWFDWEKRDIPNADKDAWIRRVKEAVPQHKVGLYCNREFWLNMDTTGYAGDALWIADWVGPDQEPRVEATWTIHQYQTTRGIDENVASFDTLAAMKQWSGVPAGGGGDLDAVLAYLDEIAKGIVLMHTANARIEDKVDQVAQLMSLPSLELIAIRDVVVDLKGAVAKLQSGQNALPKKTADEFKKRMAE